MNQHKVFLPASTCVEMGGLVAVTGMGCGSGVCDSVKPDLAGLLCATATYLQLRVLSMHRYATICSLCCARTSLPSEAAVSKLRATPESQSRRCKNCTIAVLSVQHHEA